MFDYNIIKEQMFRTNVRGGKMIIGKYKIVNKGKFISFIALILIAIIITIFIFTNNNKVYSSTYEEKYLVTNEIEIVAQINGKVRAKIVIPADASKDEMEQIALNNEKISEALEGKTIRKVIAVPGKLVNIVAN